MDLDTATAWQRSWDAQQTAYLPDREQRLGRLVDLALAAGTAAGRPGAPRVLDLACGPGSITRRLLARCPGARVWALDVDPVLLSLARTSFADWAEVRVLAADLRHADWAADLSAESFDAVLTATALHWLPEADLRRVYAQALGLVNPGGVLANADHLPLASPALQALARPARPDPGQAWEQWWREVAADAELGPLWEQRRGVWNASHAEEFTPGEEWHLAALRDGGATAASVVWRNGGDAIVAGLR